ncbi:glycoside hydrolase/deacetylase, partial [Acaromyces ingoldii]
LTLAGAVSASSSSSSSSGHKQFVRRQSAQASQYPPQLQTPPPSSLKQEWVDAYNKAKAAGKIPDVPLSTENPDGSNTYPGTYNKDWCSWTTAKCNGPNDIYQAPDNEWAISFDDGPTGASSKLYTFLEQNNQSATHFMIGSQVVDYMDVVKEAANKGQELALHTWSHSLLTTKDDLGVVGELGWNLQIIYDATGYIATKMRPPQGDIDARVRAIATEVFNVTCVMWDTESNDWCMTKGFKTACPGENPGKDRASVEAAINKALVGPKSPGVIVLEHELRKETVQIFEDYYPKLKGQGWKPKAISDLGAGMPWYTNAQNGAEAPTKADSILPGAIQAAKTSNG